VPYRCTAGSTWLLDASAVEQCNTIQDCVQIYARSAAFERDVHPRVFIESTAYTHMPFCHLQFENLLTMQSVKANVANTCRIRDQSKTASNAQTDLLIPALVWLQDMHPEVWNARHIALWLCRHSHLWIGMWASSCTNKQRSGMICSLLCLCAGVLYNSRHRKQPIERVTVYIDIEVES